jgi:hypothetical protein
MPLLQRALSPHHPYKRSKRSDLGFGEGLGLGLSLKVRIRVRIGLGLRLAFKVKG